jgi:hypothetical protein
VLVAPVTGKRIPELLSFAEPADRRSRITGFEEPDDSKTADHLRRSELAPLRRRCGSDRQLDRAAHGRAHHGARLRRDAAREPLLVGRRPLRLLLEAPPRSGVGPAQRRSRDGAGRSRRRPREATADYPGVWTRDRKGRPGSGTATYAKPRDRAPLGSSRERATRSATPRFSSTDASRSVAGTASLPWTWTAGASRRWPIFDS